MTKSLLCDQKKKGFPSTYFESYKNREDFEKLLGFEEFSKAPVVIHYFDPLYLFLYLLWSLLCFN